jgi:DNA-binding NarL/FixJ family response regulator
VALGICRGLTDKEVADRLYRSYHTVRTQKKAIYHKLGVSKDTELMWYMIFERLGREFNLSEIREKGIESI